MLGNRYWFSWGLYKALGRSSCLCWGVCRWKQLINCSEMELCKSSLVNPSDHLCSGFQQLHKTQVVSEDLMVLSWYQLKLQSQVLFFFWAFRFIWSQSKTREVEVNGNCLVKGKFMSSCAVRSWLHFAVTWSRLAWCHLNPGSWAESD